MLRRVCVFCGSAEGPPIFSDAARELGQRIAELGMELVYGGGRVGLMGAVADSVLAAGGRAIGVIPQHLIDREVAHQELTELHAVPDMHTRKAMMYDMADVFVALPGGFGTLDEVFETVTWARLGLHSKPLFLINIEGFYSGVAQQIERAVADGYVSSSDLDSCRLVSGVRELCSELDKLNLNL